MESSENPGAPTTTDVVAPRTDERTWNMFCHLSTLSGFIGVPFGNLLGPFLIWQIKKAEFPSIEAHGKEALNF